MGKWESVSALVPFVPITVCWHCIYEYIGLSLFLKGRWGPICFLGLWSRQSYQNFKSLISMSVLATGQRVRPIVFKSYYTFWLEATVWWGQTPRSIFEWHARVVLEWESLFSYQMKQTVSCWGILVVLMHLILRRTIYTSTL